MVVLVLWYAKSMSQDTEYERDVADLVYESLLFAEQEAESDQRRFSSEDILQAITSELGRAIKTF
ncbi:hypothetical protein SAMN06298221_101277 [Sphaerochaeta associata]|jgi:hypothetical protein|nr:hypothetical protein SAMN06298221_101277 [Sphaerochaeta associata]